MWSMKLFGLIAAFALLLSGCAPKVQVPPEVDLAGYGKIGIIEFGSDNDPEWQRFATQKFIEMIQSAQPGARILEIGYERKVLNSVDRAELDFEAIQVIGNEYDLDAVFSGFLKMSSIQPNVDITSLVSSANISAEVEATLMAKLWETSKGATIWTESVREKEKVAHVSLAPGKESDIDVSDPDNAYGKLIEKLAHKLTADFRVRYVRK